ncbi:cysteine hydrolase family protein [Aliarcobacter cryaerophilus]|uniref:Uncharacterized protein n=1 Tax=Aliarcobacter cryaerophilus TaxID=28198 RepID=A0AA46NS18_9BACT|nr:hypothetical protein [Aliarcobacter cryaerophilus]UYF44501.1 hypothetical protein NGX11_11135 [Aliarcobacter cryaerophilus]
MLGGRRFAEVLLRGHECRARVQTTFWKIVMSIDFQGSDIDRAALVIMHYQVDVFDILFGKEPSPLLDRCNALIRSWRATGRPVLFPNFSLGEEYEHAPPATNRQISPYLPSGRFRTGLPVEGLAIERGDLFYACPRASVFYGTALDADLRTRGVRMYSKKSQSELIENKDYNMVLLLPHNATKIIYFSKSFSIRFFLLVIKEYYVFLKVAANGLGYGQWRFA